jgi:hypothetical protein
MNNGNSFQVTFPGHNPITIARPTYAQIAYSAHAEDGLWLTVLEKAWLALPGQKLPAAIIGVLPLVGQDAQYGGMIQNAVHDLTGSDSTIYLLSRLTISAATLNARLSAAFAPGSTRVVTAGTFDPIQLLTQLFTHRPGAVPNFHAFAIVGFTPNTTNPGAAVVKFRNPWGSAGKNGSVFTMPLSEVIKNFFAIAIEK